MTDKKIGPKRRQRLREVEELYLNFYCAREIHDLIGPKWNVTHGTIKNDIVTIRKWHIQASDDSDTQRGRERYMASLQSIRRKALQGFRERSLRGDVRIKGRDYKLAHELDKEIARMNGVELKSDSRTIHVDLEKARGFIGDVMDIIMRRVDDRETQLAIIADLENLSNGPQ